MNKHRSTCAVQTFFRVNARSKGLDWFKQAAQTTVAALVIICAISGRTGIAEELAGTTVVKPGAFAASSFAGVELQVETFAPGIDPLTKTVIDVDGVTLRIYNGSTLGAPMSGQPVTMAAVEYSARDIGHVFGLAYDPRPASETVSPALYAAATSAFGLHISGPDAGGDGKPDRLLKGAPGAVFMDGLFGAGGGPGTIYKIDHATGKVVRFADVSKNGGAGLGALALDPASGTLYVSDLDSGLIHRFSTGADPADLGQFDHGIAARSAAGKPAVKDDGKSLDITSPAFDTADPATWGITQRERRVDALALSKGRLFYSVAAGPEIWSVGLEADGAFKTDARLELGLNSETGFPVASIAFDSDGRMLLAERGTVTNPTNFSGFVAAGPARVLRFTLEDPDDTATPGLWKPVAEEYAIGNAAAHRDAAGGIGIQHAYNADGTINPGVCGGTLVASSAALGPERAEHGLQLNPIELIRSGDVLATEHVYVNLNAALNDAEARGFAGGVAVLQDCTGTGFPPVADAGAGFPPVTEGGGAFPPVAGGGGGGNVVFPPVTDESTIDPGGGGKAVLTVTKTALVDKCSPKGGCAFAIEVRNDTAEDIAGPIVLSENIDAPQALLTGEPNAPWSCSKAAPFSCTHPGPVPANGVLPMRVVFTPNTPPETKEVSNCVSVVEPVGQQAPADAALPATQCAKIPLDPNAPAQFGPVILSKKGPAKCAPKGPCAFEITAINNSDTPVTGPFQFSDRIDLPGGARLASAVAPPFSCEQDGPTIFCKFADGAVLPPRASISMPITLTLDVPAGTTEVRNCVIPFFGGGGKTVPAPQNAPQNQIAPGKKSDGAPLINEGEPRRQANWLRPLAPSRRFVQQGSSLLHLTAAPGGTIGGALPDQCVNWETERGFRVEQSNGFFVVFNEIVKGANNTVSGKASWTTNNFEKSMSGTFTGVLTQTGVVNLNVSWRDGSTAVYQGALDKDGTFKGSTTSGTGFKANLNGDKRWWKCIANQRCNDYTNKAKEAADEFATFKCGASVSRWSTNAREHAAWCMGQPANSPFLQSETDARTAELAACMDLDAKCTQFGKDAALINDELKALKCKEAVTSQTQTTGPDSFKKLCRQSPQITTTDLETKLAACKTRIANGGNGPDVAEAGGAGDGGKPGGGGEVADDGRPPADLPPEQCAVVPIDPETPPGDVAEEVPPPAEQKSVAGQLTATKTLIPGSCKDGRICSFSLLFKNDGDTELAPGAVVFTDEVTADGALLGNTIVNGFTCAKLGQSFSCATRERIAAKGTLEVRYQVDIGAGAGAVKELKNCVTLKDAPTPTCATGDLTQPAPPPPPAPGNLIFAHNPEAESCSDLGGGCAFVTAVSNPANAPEFNGPLSFTVQPTQPSGEVFPNLALQSGGQAGSVDGVTAPIFCKKEGNAFTCTSAVPAKIPPGKSVPLTLMFKPGSGTAATVIKSCASLDGGEQKCANIPFVNTALLRATKFSLGNATCQVTCNFTINIQNVGNAPATGPFVFHEDFKPAVPALIKTLSGDFACNSAGGKINCISTNNKTNVLNPGETITAAVQVVNGNRAAEYTNCIGYDPAANVAPVAFDNVFPGRCVTVKETTPEPPKLEVQKVSTSNGVCDIKATCPFRITVTNTGKGQFAGPIIVTDTVDPQLPEGIAASNSPDWICSKEDARTLRCQWRRGTTLDPQQSIFLDVIVKPGSTWKKNDVLKNCALLLRTPVTEPAISCAEVKLDPFAVSVEKSGDKACPPGSNCTFKITLRNPGPIDHNAPVTITDALRQRVTAQIASITPLLPCATQPTEIPFTCTSAGPVRLDLDATPGQMDNGVEVGPRTYTMVVKMPSDGSADVYTNCIFVAASDGGAQSVPACHNVSTRPVELSISKTAASESCDEAAPCNFNIKVSNASAKDIPGPITINDLTRIGRTPMTNIKLVSASAPWTCISSAAPGMQCSHPGPVPANGTLDLALSLQPLAGSLVGATELRNCAGLAGESAADANACATIPVKITAPPPPPVPPTCAGDMVLTNGTCACPEFLRWNGRECVGTGGINTSRPGDETNDPVPIIPTGPATKPLCPEGFIGSPPNCCPRGTEFRNGACRGPQSPPTPPPPCPEGFIGSPPNCCPRGTEFRNGACRGPKPPKEVGCPRGQNRDPKTGVCFSCSHNDVFVNGKCVPKKAPPPPQQCPPDRPVGKFPRCCPQNAQFINGQCRCLPGLQFRRGQCVAVQPPPVNCPQGQILVNGKCRILAIPTPGPKPPRDCGPGYRPLDKPNKYGAFCEAIPSAGPCPPGWTGTKPNCQPPKVVYPPCPPGWSGTPGNCKPPVVKPPPPPPRKVCPPNATGTPPNCTCRGNSDYDPGSNRCFKGPS